MMNLLTVLFVQFFTSFCIADIIRCYCNLPECESTKNTCQFEGGGCFSDFLDYLNITHARHGCLHLLPRSQRELCGNAPGSTGAPRSLLLCCQLDMCNHLLSPSAQITHSLIGSLMNATERDTEGMQVLSGAAKQHEVWLKAATIAVPICGAMILTLLVVLACKVLRGDEVRAAAAAVAAPKFPSNASCPSSGQLAANKLPLLSTSDFRSFTSNRIHCGQHVNLLSEPKIEKNTEYARANIERLHGDDEDVDETPSHISLNLDKLDSINSCNLFEIPKNKEPPNDSDKYSKIYNKNLI